MKKMICALCAAAMLLSLCACRRAPEVAETAAPAETPAPAQTAAPDETPDTAPVLSSGAAETSALSDLFCIGEDGTLYSSLIRADGVTCVYDILPDDVGCIAGFAVSDDGIYAVIKDSYYSLDPAALYFFPSDGGERLLTDSVLPGGVFCLAGNSLLYPDYESGSLFCADLSGGSVSSVADGQTFLIGASGGFIYYAKDGGIYRNDSTLGAEVRMFADNGTSRLHADDGGLYDLIYTDDGDGSILELRALDGTLRTELTLPALADSSFLCNGTIYVPQPSSQTVLSIDAASGETLGEISFSELGEYAYLRYAAPDALYFETYIDDTLQFCRIGTDGAGAEFLGESIIF